MIYIYISLIFLLFYQCCLCSNKDKSSHYFFFMVPFSNLILKNNFSVHHLNKNKLFIINYQKNIIKHKIYFYNQLLKNEIINNKLLYCYIK